MQLWLPVVNKGFFYKLYVIHLKGTELKVFLFRWERKKIKKFGHEDLQSILSGRKVNSYFSHYLAWPLKSYKKSLSIRFIRFFLILVEEAKGLTSNEIKYLWLPDVISVLFPIFEVFLVLRSQEAIRKEIKLGIQLHISLSFEQKHMCALKSSCRQIWSNMFDVVLVFLLAQAVFKTLFLMSLCLRRLYRRCNIYFPTSVVSAYVDSSFPL